MNQEDALHPLQDHLIFKHGMLSFSSICKGEIFGSYIQRQPQHNPIQPDMQLCASDAFSWLLPRDIQRYADLLGEYVVSLEYLLSYNTLLPGFRRFLAPDDATRVREYHVGPTDFQIASTVGCAGGRQGLSSDPGICIECIKEDISANGEAFWRRDFLLSNVRWCARHQTPVRSLCDACVYTFQHTRRFISPQSVCYCGRPLILRSRDDNVQELELEMARGWSQLLDCKFEPKLNGPEVATLTHIKAKELGLVDRSGVRWKIFQDFFEQPKLQSLGKSLGFSFRNEPARDALRGVLSMRNPCHALFLLVAMYGSWDAVKTEILWPCGFRGYGFDKAKYESNASKMPNASANWERQYARSVDLMTETVHMYARLRNDYPELGHLAIRVRLPYENARAASRARLEEHGVLLPPLEGIK
jgi:hypothetical protein